MKKKILFVHTTGSWWDHRYYFKQMPALESEYAEVSYLIKEDETINNVPFKLIIISSNKAKWARRTGGFNLFFKLFKSKQDAIQLCNIELLPVGILLALFSSKKIFYDCREDHYHAMLHSKVWFPKWFRYLLGFGVKFLEFFAAKTFTGFIDSDPAIYSFHTAVPKTKKMIFYNMALKSQFKTGENTSPKKYDFSVLGSMSVRTGVLDVVKAIATLKDNGRDVTLKLIGDPKFDKLLWNKIGEVIKKAKLENNIKITGRIPYFEMPEALSDCRVGIVPLLNLPKFQNNIATKQFEYMASGMPVIASNLKPQKYFIKKGYNGFHYEAGNVEGLVDKMSLFLDSPDLIDKLSRNAINDVLNNKINSEEQQLKYLEFYKLRMSGKPYIETQIPNLND